MNSIVITIDGPSGSGKGTTARGVAELLSIPHIDSGSIYRTIAYILNNAHIKPDDDIAIMDFLHEFHMKYSHEGRVLYNEVDIEDVIRSRENSKIVFNYSRNQVVRTIATKVQRELLADGGVLDGRDAATVVAPDADLKIYLECDIDERVRRRAKQYRITDQKEIEEIKQEIQDRDKSDKNNSGSLTILPDSVLVDTCGLSAEEQIQKVYKRALEKI